MSKRHRRFANRPPAATGLGAKAQDFNPDYSNVKRDLRRIGALAGFFILVLVVLSFFLR
jgi:hypothetical protein